MLSIKYDADKPKNSACQSRVLCFHFMSLLTFVLMFGLGFGECLSSGCNVYLAVDTAYGCALWGACTCNSEVSTNSEQSKRFHMWAVVQPQIAWTTVRALCLPRQAFPGVSVQ